MRIAVLAAYLRKKTTAVESPVFEPLSTSGFSDSGQEVSGIDQVRTNAPGRGNAFPPRNHRHVHPVVGSQLLAAGNHPPTHTRGSFTGRAVIAEEQHQCVLGEPEAVELRDKAAELLVSILHHVAKVFRI